MELNEKKNQILLDLLGSALFHQPLTHQPEPELLEQIFEESKHQTVVAMVCDVLPEEYAKQTPEIFGRMQEYALKVVGSNSLVVRVENWVHTQLKKAGLPACTIKGSASARYYPDPLVRQMGDVDVLIDAQMLDQVTQVLVKNGCKVKLPDHSFHRTFMKNGVCIEVHTQVGSLPKGREYIFDCLEGILSDIRYERFMDYDLPVPNRYYHGLVMLLHMQRHLMKGEGIGLRHLCDWAVFSNACGDEFTQVFGKTLKEIGFWRFACALSCAASRHLKMPARSWFADFDAPVADALFLDIMQGGNFGQKDADRVKSSIFVERDSKKRATIVTLFRALNRQVYYKMPFFKRWKCLLPFGYIAYLFRLLWRLITRKTKVNVSDTVSRGKARNALYRNLQFFEKQ